MISVICPTFNEEENIKNVLEFFVSSSFPRKELLIIDGKSDDGTQQIVQDYAKRYDNIRLLQNKKKYVPFALNVGIKNSSGDPIIRLDAHTEYSKDYFEKILETFEETGADIVGGPMRAEGKSEFQRAVAYCTSTKFGIGDSKIHNERYKGESDHVYLGAWKRKIFDEIGYFDERLYRNQDDEFHYRAKSLGKRIYLNPEIRSFYYPRSNINSLIKQYFQYGLFKPLVVKKIKSEIKLRHIIPSVFVLYLLLIPLAIINLLYLSPLIIYIITDMLFSILNRNSLWNKMISLIVFPILHICYGIGFLLGISKTFKS